MTDPDTISADYSLHPSELASTLALLVEARQPVVVWGAPGCAKSQIAQQVAAQAGREYVDVRALLLDPVDLRGIPWRDGADRTRWAPPAFLPPSDADGSWLINLEELPSALPMVQAALYQLVLDRKCGEYELPEGAALIAYGNREGDRGVVHRMPAPLASRFVHLEIRVDATDWCAWGAANGIAPEVLFFVSMRPELLHAFNPQSTEKAFPCPRTWEMVSNIVHRRGGLDPVAERALFRGTVGEAAAVEFSAFLQVWHELPHPRTVIDDPEGAVVPGNASALIALCGSLYRMADDINLGAIVTYATRLRREVGEFLVGSCIRREPALQHPKHRSEGHAIQVSEAFLDEVQALLSHLKKPPTASSVGVPRKKIKTASLTDGLGDLADEMKQHGFSHVPIVDERDAVIGVFNEAAVFDHLWAEAETIVGRRMQISDILPHCRFDAGHTENFKFVKPTTPIDDLAEMFLALESPTTRVGASFVTASGKKTEPLQGLITPWDVLAMSYD